MKPSVMRKYELKRRLYLAQKGVCFYCNKIMYPHRSTIDHFVPQKILKEKEWSLKFNKVLAHKECNVAKGHRFPTKPEVQKLRALYKVLEVTV